MTPSAVRAAYPERPIRIIVPFAPGGPNDVLARLVGSKLTEAWGQPILVDNRGGAGGTIGAEAGARAAPDGYTLTMGGSSNLTVAPNLYAKLPYNPLKDFTPVSNVARVPYLVVINPRVPAKTVKELVALARSKPGYLNYASSGVGSMSSLAAEWFNAVAGTQIVHIPFKGTAPALTELMVGSVDLMMADMGLALAQARAGKMRAIAITTPNRSATAPDIPTAAESGLPGFELSPWFGIVGPAGMARETVERLNREINSALKTPDMQKRFAELGYEPALGSAETFAAEIRKDIELYGRIVKKAGIKAEL
ncbi:MAG: tripartite tricarboxylate transporter substrate binding protein [Proteobacteria bacterium]|nr:tripartite tricarboxylate transporter substrate binding protein [Burkholderiales bacterium]